MSKNIVILGGGMGGIVAANELRKKLPDEYKVILIDKRDSHFYYPSLLWVLAGERNPEQIVRKVDRLTRKGIEFHQACVDKINLTAKKVQAGGEVFNYDYLIIAMGADLNCGAIPGISAGQCLYELEGVLNIREKLKAFPGGKVFVVIAGKPYKCPAAPIEAALFLDTFFKGKKIRDKVELKLFTVEEGPMGVAGPRISGEVRKMVEKKGIEYLPALKLTAIDQQNKDVTFDNGQKHYYDLLLVIPPLQAPEFVKAAGLPGESGWIPVNPQTLETKHPGVFAIGDITGIKLTNGKSLPKAGVFAHFEAEVVAANIISRIKGKKPAKEFTGGGACFLDTGKGSAGVAFGNFYATPNPKVTMLPPLKLGYWGKVLFEKWWLRKWF